MTNPTPEALRIALIAKLTEGDLFSQRLARQTVAYLFPIITDALAEKEAQIADLLKNIDTMETALNQIASSHYERWGVDQTDVEELPDLSSDEAMNIARAALENTNDKG